MNLQQAKDIYVASAIFICNLLVIFVVINLAVAGYDLSVGRLQLFQSASRSTNPVSERYGNERLALVYPGKTQQQIQVLLAETWSRPYVYEPFTQFREGLYRGQYVNVEHGFRRSANQAAWPPDPRRFNVFVFGGSTTFGYGVADSETVASHLQDEIRARTGLPVAIYNFGRGFYYSTQERVLFEQLVSSGQRPQLTIFIDGLNEFYHRSDEPRFSSSLRVFLASDHSTDFWSSWSGAAELPAIRAARRAAARLACWLRDCKSIQREATEEAEEAAKLSTEDQVGAIAKTLNRYRTNRRLIEAAAAAFGIAAAFVWQPVPTYKYDQTSHLFAGSDYYGSLAGYRLFAAEMRDSPADDFIWCADIQEGRHEPLYVDQVHYTPSFAKTLAICIASQLRERGLLR